MRARVASLALYGFVFLASTGCVSRNARDLGAWERMTERPGFTLLESRSTRGYHLAVYDTGKSELALCYQWYGSQAEPSAMAFRVRTPAGVDVGSDEEATTDLTWKHESLLATTVGSDGLVVPIRPDYSGPLMIQISDKRGVVYAGTVNY